MATSNITDQNLARLVTQAGDDALALQQIATFYGLSAGDLSQITGIPTKTYNKLFLDAGIPLGTVLTGDVPATAAQKANVKTIGKGDDLVVEKAVGKQGDKILVQQYDAYGNKTSTRLADPNTSEGKGWLQALGIVGLATFGPAAFEAFGATGAGTSAAAAGEGVLAGTTAADIMAATEALEAAGATTLGSSAGVPAALTATEAAAAGATAGVPAALGSTAPASLTVAASSLPAATSIIPELATAGVLGGAALTSGLTGEGIIANEAANVAQQQNVTNQNPADVATPGVTTTATTAAGASILKQLADATGLSEDTLKTILKGAAGLFTGYASYKDAEAAREAAKGKPFKSSSGYQTVTGAGGVTGFKKAASGGVMSVLNEKGPEDYGIGSLTEDMSIGEYEPEQFNSDTFYQAYANDVYAPEGLIANEVVRRAAFEMPETFDPRNLAFQKEKEVSINEARNRLLSEVMSVDQITGDIDPIQSIKNIAAYDPTFLQSVPDLRKFVENVQSLSPTGYDAKYGFKAPYADKFTPEDIRTVRVFGPEYQNMLDVIGNILENREGDYTTGGIGGGYGGAAGGIASLQPKRKLPPRYLDGHSDGMADKVPANIDGKRPAALSDGEFVIPADVVSHLGNGNSNAGAKRLYKMMDDIRAARTGNPKQGKQINPDKFMPR